MKLIQATVKQDQEISTAISEIQKCQNKQHKGQMTINGFLKTASHGSLKDDIQKFLQEKVKLPRVTPITSAYRMNKAKVWFQLEDPNDTALIFKHVSNLKGQKNANERFYRIDEFLTEKEADKKTRMKDMKMENSRIPFTHQLTLSTEKGVLYSGTEENKHQYRRLLTKPVCRDYLLQTKEEEIDLEHIHIINGPCKEQEGSTFHVMAARIESIEELKKTYRRIKNDHCMATHVMGGYRIFGQDHIHLQDYYDDGEYGGGRRILQQLKEQQIFNLAIFVARYKEGGNIGKARFDIITELTKSVIAKVPGNIDHGKRDSEEEIELAKALKKAYQAPRRHTTSNE